MGVTTNEWFFWGGNPIEIMDDLEIPLFQETII